MINVKKAYAFDDLLMVPKYSRIESRSNVDLSVDLGKGFKLSIPIISACMKHVTGVKMAEKLSQLGGLPILHRFCTIDEQVDMFMSLNISDGFAGCAVGVKEEDKDRVKELVEACKCNIICVDVAHGHSKICGDMVSWIASKYPEILLIAGNVATIEGADYLAVRGANAIRVNIGSGSLCSTRIQTGFGVPALSCLSEVYDGSFDYCNKSKRRYKIIQDGGVKNSGDIAKSLVFSDVVMLGNLLAGTLETPGEPLMINNQMVKEYEGSSTHKSTYIEGVKGYVPFKGPVEIIIENLMQGLRSACSYQGVSNLEDFKKDVQFVEISNSGLLESRPHSIMVK
jgi:IMP dehydrogenase